MHERAAQALVKLALEPEWEAKLEPNVYGFRAGRSCLDAIAAIFNIIRQRPKYVLEGDIFGCFDNISHSALLEKTKPHRSFNDSYGAGSSVESWMESSNLQSVERRKALSRPRC